MEKLLHDLNFLFFKSKLPRKISQQTFLFHGFSSIKNVIFNVVLMRIQGKLTFLLSYSPRPVENAPPAPLSPPTHRAVRLWSLVVALFIPKLWRWLWF
jgi:hypothetical protein